MFSQLKNDSAEEDDEVIQHQHHHQQHQHQQQQQQQHQQQQHLSPNQQHQQQQHLSPNQHPNPRPHPHPSHQVVVVSSGIGRRRQDSFFGAPTSTPTPITITDNGNGTGANANGNASSGDKPTNVTDNVTDNVVATATDNATANANDNSASDESSSLNRDSSSSSSSPPSNKLNSSNLNILSTLKLKESAKNSLILSPSANQTTPSTTSTTTNRLTMLRRSTTKTNKAMASNDPFRFQGEGVDFKGKLIGVRDVEGARGDAMCAEAMRLAKAAIKSTGQHKQRIVLNISIEGLKIKDEKTLTTLHNFPVSRISFIARDTTDARAFGFIYGCADNQYKFYGIKTTQTADRAVLAIRDMFQIVFEMKKAHLAEVKQRQEEQQQQQQQNKDNAAADGTTTENGVRMDNGVAVADLLDLESEIHNIEQGVHQLQNIPAFPEDSWWPNADGLAVPLPAVNGVAPALAGAPGLGSAPAPAFPFAAAAGSPPSTGGDPFGDSFRPPASAMAPPVGVVFSSNASPTLPQVPPVVFQQQQQQHPLMANPLQTQAAAGGGGANSWPQINTVHSAPNFHVAAFSETNPFILPAVQPGALTLANGGGTAVADPFDTQSAQHLIKSLSSSNNNNNSNYNNISGAGGQHMQYHRHHHQPPSNIHWPTNENSAPRFTANFTSDERSNAASESRKVTSLEEAFTKLVDMDALVSSGSEVKKTNNPFDNLLNPPKIPLSAMGTNPPMASSCMAAASRQQSAPLICSGANNSDPFNDAFFR